MEKKTDCVVMYHREMDYPLWDNEIWTPIEVGAALREPVYEGFLRDNADADNISEWNGLFAENTGIYYNWKHLTGKKYAGQIQYRRRFDITTFSELQNMFEEHNVIAARPLAFNCTLRQQYDICHNPKDLDIFRDITLQLYPEYREPWDKYIEKGRRVYYSNGFIMREEDYARYCEWLFSILFAYKDAMGWKTPEELDRYIEMQIANRLRPNHNGYGRPENAVAYQRQIAAFASERLWALYLQTNYTDAEILHLPYLKMESCI